MTGSPNRQPQGGGLDRVTAWQIAVIFTLIGMIAGQIYVRWL
jgi:hypothetical protein